MYIKSKKYLIIFFMLVILSIISGSLSIVYTTHDVSILNDKNLNLTTANTPTDYSSSTTLTPEIPFSADFVSTTQSGWSNSWVPNKIFEAPNGYIYVTAKIYTSSCNYGLFVSTDSGAHFSQLGNIIGDKKSASTGAVNFYADQKTGYYYIAYNIEHRSSTTEDHHLLSYSTDGIHFSYVDNPKIGYDKNQQTVVFFKKINGTLYVGTNTKLYTLNINPKNKDVVPRLSALYPNTINSLCSMEYINNVIYIGANKVYSMTTDSKKLTKIANISDVRNIINIPDKSLNNTGLYLFNLYDVYQIKNGQKPKHMFSDQFGLGTVTFDDSLLAKNETLYFSATGDSTTSSKSGVYGYAKDGTLTKSFSTYDPNDPNNPDNTYFISQTSNGNIYSGTTSKLYFSSDNGKTFSLGFDDYGVHSMLQSANGFLYFACDNFKTGSTAILRQASQDFFDITGSNNPANTYLAPQASSLQSNVITTLVGSRDITENNFTIKVKPQTYIKSFTLNSNPGIVNKSLALSKSAKQYQKLGTNKLVITFNDPTIYSVSFCIWIKQTTIDDNSIEYTPTGKSTFVHQDLKTLYQFSKSDGSIILPKNTSVILVNNEQSANDVSGVIADIKDKYLSLCVGPEIQGDSSIHKLININTKQHTFDYDDTFNNSLGIGSRTYTDGIYLMQLVDVVKNSPAYNVLIEVNENTIPVSFSPSPAVSKLMHELNVSLTGEIDSSQFDIVNTKLKNLLAKYQTEINTYLNNNWVSYAHGFAEPQSWNYNTKLKPVIISINPVPDTLQINAQNITALDELMKDTYNSDVQNALKDLNNTGTEHHIIFTVQSVSTYNDYQYYRSILSDINTNYNAKLRSYLSETYLNPTYYSTICLGFPVPNFNPSSDLKIGTGYLNNKSYTWTKTSTIDDVFKHQLNTSDYVKALTAQVLTYFNNYYHNAGLPSAYLDQKIIAAQTAVNNSIGYTADEIENYTGIKIKPTDYNSLTKNFNNTNESYQSWLVASAKSLLSNDIKKAEQNVNLHGHSIAEILANEPNLKLPTNRDQLNNFVTDLQIASDKYNDKVNSQHKHNSTILIAVIIPIAVILLVVGGSTTFFLIKRKKTKTNLISNEAK